MSPLELLSRWWHERAGQMRRHHQIGKWLTFLGGLPSTRTVVEVGTWSGAGSSTLLAKAMHRRASAGAKIIGLEIDPRMVRISKSRLKQWPVYTVFHGTVVETADLDNRDLNAEERIWFEQDKSRISLAPNVLHLLPEKIDLCILDGGEFSSYAEYQVLLSRLTGWLVLDDVKTRKNRRVLEEAVQSGDFILVDISEERHGTAVLKKLQF